MERFDPAKVPDDTEFDNIARKLASQKSVNVDPKANIYGVLQDIGGDDNDSAYFAPRKVEKSVDRKWLRAKESCAPTASDLLQKHSEPEVRLRNKAAAKGGTFNKEAKALKREGMSSDVDQRLANVRHVMRGVGAV